MYKRDLENLISQKQLPNAFLLYGVCEYQINFYEKAILSQWNEFHDEIWKFYFDFYDFKTTKNVLSQNSLFGNKNIALIKTDKNISKNELEELILICEKNPNSHLLVEYFSDDKTASSLSKIFSKKGVADFARFFKPNLNEALIFLNQKAKELNLEIQNYALNQLFLAQKENLALAINELEKLAVLDMSISKNEIDRFVYGLGEVGLEECVCKLIDKKDIKFDFQILLECGHYTHIDIVLAIQKYIQQLYLFHLYIKIHGTLNIKEVLGYMLPKNLADTRASQCMRLTLTTYKRAFEALSAYEFDLKTQTHIDKDAKIHSLLLTLTSILK